SIFRSLGKPANLAGRIVRPHRNRLAHGKPPQFAILNHAAIDSGIPRESATQRLGITRLPHRRIRPSKKHARAPPRAWPFRWLLPCLAPKDLLLCAKHLFMAARVAVTRWAQPARQPP